MRSYDFPNAVPYLLVLNRVGIYCESRDTLWTFRASPRYTRSIAAPRATHGNSPSCSFWSRRSPVYPPTPSPSRLSVPEARCCPLFSGCSRMRLGMFAWLIQNLPIFNVLRQKIVGPSVSVCASAVVIIAPGTAVLVETTVLGRILRRNIRMVAQSARR
jgi:hypothetical protein